MPRLDDEDSALPPHDLLRLAEHHLELSGVLSRFLGHLERTPAGNDVPKSHDSALTLRNDLLRHNEDISVDELVSGGRDGSEHEPHEIVLWSHFGDPVDRDDRKGHP